MENKNYVGAYNVAKVEVEILDSSINYNRGDLVLIDSVDGLLILGRIANIYKGDALSQEAIEASNKAKCWAVNKIDTTKHKERIKATERKKFIQQQLQLRKEAIEEQAVWALLAEQDPTVAELLEELKSLG